jgi:hypothetical protein
MAAEVLLVCGHAQEGMTNRLRPPDAEVYCFRCQMWTHRLEDDPYVDEAHGRIPEDADFALGPEDAR